MSTKADPAEFSGGLVDAITLTEMTLAVEGWIHSPSGAPKTLELIVNDQVIGRTDNSIVRKVRAQTVTAGFIFRVELAELPTTNTTIVVRDVATGWMLPKSRAAREIQILDSVSTDAASNRGLSAPDPVSPSTVTAPAAARTSDVLLARPLEAEGPNVLRPDLARRPGKLEFAIYNRISGWAVNQTSDAAPEVTIYINDLFYVSLPASTRRADLGRAGINGYGFSTSVPELIGDPEKSVVEAKVDNKSIGRITLSHAPSDDLETSPITPWASGPHRQPVSIIVPIHNAADALRECLDSLISYTSTTDTELILIDDQSSDPTIREILLTLHGRTNVTILTNMVRLGFGGTVNRGIAHARGRDVVLLNSDTRVTRRWLEHMRQAAYARPRIASVTAMSDNAGVFSLPAIEATSGWSDEEIGRLASQVGSGRVFSVPTCHGFCTYLRRDAIDEIGLFDNGAFPHGYGEENDWSVRANYAGWEHVVDSRVIVFHRRAASFGLERTELVKQGLEILRDRYPEYDGIASRLAYDRHFLMAKYRFRAQAARLTEAHKRPKPRILYVISSLSGGTPQTNQDLMHALSWKFDTFVLHCERRQVRLLQYADGKLELRSEATLNSPIDVRTHRSVEYDNIVSRWIDEFRFELLHVRHIAWHSLGLFDVVHAREIPIIFSLHDYYITCPSVKLLDNEMVFCGGVCTEGDGVCVAALWPVGSVPHLKHKWVTNWRKLLAPSIAKCDGFVSTSESVIDLARRDYPSMQSAIVKIIEHGRSFEEFGSDAAEITSGPLRIAVPGNISDAKGAAIIAALKQLDHESLLEFHIIGKHGRSLNDVDVVRHGPYERRDLAEILRKIGPHIGAVLSIWPETYCHTLTELWASGLPVVGFDVGAVGSRLRANKGGWLAEPTPAAVFELLMNIRNDAADHQLRVAEVSRWQRGPGRSYGAAEMGAEYASMYDEVFERRSRFAPLARASSR